MWDRGRHRRGRGYRRIPCFKVSSTNIETFAVKASGRFWHKGLAGFVCSGILTVDAKNPAWPNVYICIYTERERERESLAYKVMHDSYHQEHVWLVFGAGRRDSVLSELAVGVALHHFARKAGKDYSRSQKVGT